MIDKKTRVILPVYLAQLALHRIESHNLQENLLILTFNITPNCIRRPKIEPKLLFYQQNTIITQPIIKCLINKINK